MIKSGWPPLLVLFLFFGFFADASAAALTGHAWSENIGWIKFSGPGYGVDYDKAAGQFSGYGWSENIGWIKFNPETARACAGAMNPDCTGPVSSQAGGWDGEIHLAGSSYGVKTTKDQCGFKGYGWGSDVIGWIKFKGPGYGVRFQECLIPDTEESVITCAFDAIPSRIISPRKTATLNWACDGADSCLIEPAVGIVALAGSQAVRLQRTTTYTLACGNSLENKEYQTTITVIKPAYCEVIPFLGTCR